MSLIFIKFNSLAHLFECLVVGACLALFGTAFIVLYLSWPRRRIK
jgi:hypothetical protein